ncbi:hypothetical protein [Gloeobacter morelensis]|uniref:Uncharacterized protein n=1 Tax=Gloeobacter morelensis MG652769 TaxID=2781736 RepID=A0ABY3PRS2_9CYAN|nr:hypothetical protein [Gloeobacter morelensis]UFP96142.1 hypothetical protein ISF26_08030 [Gloeobacter morelensis MG652769]
MNTDCEVGQSRQVLNELKEALVRGDEFIRLRAHLQLTKSARSYSETVLQIDRLLEQMTRHWQEGIVPFARIADRYRTYDPDLQDLGWPRHLPARVVEGTGTLSSGSNVFILFPDSLGLEPQEASDTFGFELIDVLQHHFIESGLRAAREVLDLDSQRRAQTALTPTKLGMVIYLIAAIHEISHRAGPWRVLPCSPRSVSLSEFHQGVMGELAANTLSVVMLPEFPEIQYYVTLQHLLSTGRRGFRHDPLSASINEDCDCWISIYYWNKLLEYGALQPNGHTWHLNHELALSTYRAILEEIDALAKVIAATAVHEHDGLVHNWMSRQVDYADRGFTLPPTLQAVYHRCQSIGEIPHFTPLLQYRG